VEETEASDGSMERREERKKVERKRTRKKE